jgi:peptide/nickel transport system substrate-binding protein
LTVACVTPRFALIVPIREEEIAVEHGSRHRTPGRTRRLAVAAVLTVGLAACGNESGSGDSGSTKTSLTIAVPSAVTSLNPTQIGTGIPDQFFVQAAYDSLIVRGADGSLEPGLATAWEYTDPENTTFQLTLREGVTFSDGSKFDAQAVADWIEYYQNSNGLFASRFATIDSVEVNDPTTVTLHLAQSDAAWPESLTQDRYGYVISPEGIADPETLGTQTFGAGPYVLDSDATVTGSSYVYTRNDDYWNPDAQHWEKITVKVIEDPSARLSALQSGQADVAIGDSTTAQAAEGSDVEIVTAPFLWNTLVLLDRNGEKSAPLADVRVRQALNYAVDRGTVATGVFGDYGDPNVSMVTPDFLSYSDEAEERYSYDPDKAKSLLAEAGYPDGFTLEVLVWNRNGLESRFTEALIDYYKAIGVTLNLHVESDAGTVIGALQNKEYPAFTFFGQIEDANLLTQEQLLPASGVLNPFAVTDQELVDLYNQYQATPAGPERQAVLQEMQAHIVDQGIYVTVSTSDEVYFHTQKVEGLDVTGAEPIMNLYTLRPVA